MSTAEQTSTNRSSSSDLSTLPGGQSAKRAILGVLGGEHNWSALLAAGRAGTATNRHGHRVLRVLLLRGSDVQVVDFSVIRGDIVSNAFDPSLRGRFATDLSGVDLRTLSRLPGGGAAKAALMRGVGTAAYQQAVREGRVSIGFDPLTLGVVRISGPDSVRDFSVDTGALVRRFPGQADAKALLGPNADRILAKLGTNAFTGKQIGLQGARVERVRFGRQEVLAVVRPSPPHSVRSQTAFLFEPNAGRHLMTIAYRTLGGGAQARPGTADHVEIEVIEGGGGARTLFPPHAPDALVQRGTIYTSDRTRGFHAVLAAGQRRPSFYTWDFRSADVYANLNPASPTGSAFWDGFWQSTTVKAPAFYRPAANDSFLGGLFSMLFVQPVPGAGLAYEASRPAVTQEPVRKLALPLELVGLLLPAALRKVASRSKPGNVGAKLAKEIDRWELDELPGVEPTTAVAKNPGIRPKLYTLQHVGEAIPNSAIEKVDEFGNWIVYKAPNGQQRIRFRASQAVTLQRPTPSLNNTDWAEAAVSKQGRPFVVEGRHRSISVARGETSVSYADGFRGPDILDYEYYPDAISSEGKPVIWYSNWDGWKK